MLERQYRYRLKDIDIGISRELRINNPLLKWEITPTPKKKAIPTVHHKKSIKRTSF